MSTANNEINDQVAAILGISNAPIANAPMLVVSAPIPPVVPRVEHLTPAVRTDQPDQVANDAEFARDNLYDVIQKVGVSIDELMSVAQQSQSPRAYEVLNQLLNTQREAAAQLLKLQSDRQKITGTTPLKPSGPMQIANAVFVGTNAQLLDLIKGKDRVQEAEIADAEFFTQDEPSANGTAT
jgi:hypothetical protein